MKRRHLPAAMLIFGLVALGGSTGRAAMMLIAESVRLPFSQTDQSGSFDVYVLHDESSPPLVGHQARLSLAPADSGAVFTGVDLPLTHSYVFPSSMPVGAIASGGSIVTGGDFLFTGSSPLDSGVGLLSISFTVAGGTPIGSAFDVIIDSDPSQTFLADDELANIDFLIQNGQISIIAIPEPASPTFALLAGSLFGFYVRRNRRRSLSGSCMDRMAAAANYSRHMPAH